MNEMVRRRPAPEPVVRRAFPVAPVVGVAGTVLGAVGHQVGLVPAIVATLLVVAVAVGVGRLLVPLSTDRL